MAVKFKQKMQKGMQLQSELLLSLILIDFYSTLAESVAINLCMPNRGIITHHILLYNVRLKLHCFKDGSHM